jgi:dTDP-4-amino-4,6-dideoxygalactose transaminase/8-oxo-dGTP pyrophosphatase MutT (NUDIX family)
MDTPRTFKYNWPPIDGDVTQAILRQLADSTSIYDRSGVIADFENRFSQLHGCRYGLLTSSGTAALHSAYYALGIGPGDEVLCPAYTFFATAAPLLQLGALPILVDSNLDGMVDLAEARRLLTPRTRALVLTHMWGYPSPVPLYREFCDENGLALVEDCSHAHGARFEGTPVGATADAAVWSLQAAKLIPAGEGGILCTNNEDIYAKANLLGHFNKRAMAEVPAGHPLYPFAETGLGLKYRSHPLGVAMAAVFLDRLEDLLAGKLANARRIEQIVREHDSWLAPLRPIPRNARCSFYAFPMLVLADNPDRRRRELADRMHELGFLDFDIPRSMRSLSLFPIFQSPRSPVADYAGSSLRRPTPLAEHLSESVVKISVPVERDARADDFIDAFAACLAACVPSPSRHESGTRTGFTTEDIALEAALRTATEDHIGQLVVGAVIWRIHDDQPQVLIARRRKNDFLGGYEELVGGGVEAGETIVAALRREVFEETGTQVGLIQRVVDTFDYINEWGTTARQVNFSVQVVAEPRIQDGWEHTEIRWIGPDEVQLTDCTAEVKQSIRWWFAMWSNSLVG